MSNLPSNTHSNLPSNIPNAPDIRLDIINQVGKLHFNYKFTILNQEKYNFNEKLKALFNELQIKNITRDVALGKTIILDNYNFSLEEEYYVILAVKTYFYLNINIFTSTDGKKCIYFGNPLNAEMDLLNKYKK